MGYPKQKPLDDYILKLEELTQQMRVENRRMIDGAPHERAEARFKIIEVVEQMQTLQQAIKRKIGVRE